MDADEKHFDELLQAARDDQQVLEFSCARYRENVQLLCGQHYSTDGSDYPVPINKFALLESVLTPLLAGQDPAFDVTTTDRALRSVALSGKLAFPHMLHQLRYADMARRVFVSSLFAPMGIAKVGRRLIRTVEIEGLDFKDTRMFADEVLWENFLFDTQAPVWHEVQYAADRVHVLFDRFMDEHGKHMKPLVRDKLAARSRRESAEDDGIGAQVSEISRRSSSHRGQYLKTLPIWLFWCRDTNTVKVGSGLSDSLLLFEDDYAGPVDGPYHFLFYHYVPGQILGLSPAAVLRDMTEAINMSANKAIRQAELQKTVYEFRDSATAETVRRLPDGHTYSSTTPGAFAPVRIGGPDQANIGMVQFGEQVFDGLGYPLSLLGGVAAQSPTATQDSILQGNAGKLIQQMAHCIHRFHESCGHHLWQLMWEDEMFDPELVYVPPGAHSTRFSMSFAPEQRRGAPDRYAVKVIPYSMMVLSPRERWGQAMQFVQQIVIPALPYMGQQGVQVDWAKLIRGYAQAYGFDAEMQEALIYSAQREMSAAGEARQSPVTTRVNERVNRGSGNNAQKRAQDMAQMLMSGGNGNAGVNGSGGTY